MSDDEINRIRDKLWEIADRLARLEAGQGLSQRDLDAIRADVRALMSRDINVTQQTIVGDDNQTAGRDAKHG